MAIMLEQYSSQGLKTNKAKDQECIRFDVVVVVVIVVGLVVVVVGATGVVRMVQIPG